MVKVSPNTLREIRAALEEYKSIVTLSEDLTAQTKKTYLEHPENFVRWLEGDFYPGATKRLRNPRVGRQNKATSWPFFGESGNQYDYVPTPFQAFSHYPIFAYPDAPGNYMFVQWTPQEDSNWVVLYIGQTESLYERITNHEKIASLLRPEDTVLFFHENNGGPFIRQLEERDLIAKYRPALNRQS